MTIEQVANKLNKCATCKGNDGCEYSKTGEAYVICKGRLIQAMADECRMIAERGDLDDKI